MEKANMSLL